jgi:hypothetical protein
MVSFLKSLKGITMPRHPEPLFFIQWRDIATRTPRICHTCENYSIDGVCAIVNMEPPEKHAATENVCDDWILEVGF